jgi:hypothetical protein
MIRESAMREMSLVGMSDSDMEAVLQILDIFFDNWDSGGAVAVMIPVLNRLLCGAPLSPLTGDDDEWMDCSEYTSSTPGELFQNRRYTAVFKEKKHGGGYRCFDVNRGRTETISFPYDPVPQFREPTFVVNIP